MRHTGAPITSLRLIDFGSSVVRQSDESLKAGLSKGKPVVFEVEAANEIRKVCGMLGYAIKKT
jgi:Cft2 family RNA processing exonuclease